LQKKRQDLTPDQLLRARVDEHNSTRVDVGGA